MAQPSINELQALTATRRLLSYGVSLLGARQFLSAEKVLSREDRLRLINVIADLIGQSSTKSAGGSRSITAGGAQDISVGAAQMIEQMQKRGVSPAGAREFLNGLAISAPHDRAVFAVWVTVGFFEVRQESGRGEGFPDVIVAPGH